MPITLTLRIVAPVPAAIAATATRCSARRRSDQLLDQAFDKQDLTLRRKVAKNAQGAKTDK
jgi:hypothetical protein